MSEIEKLKREIQSLKDKNKSLELKLQVAKLWMIKQVRESVKTISKRKISKLTWETKKNFARENLEDIITNKIRDYFGDFILMNISSNFIENIISWEIAYYELKQNPNFDWFSVVSSYHKALDIVIEQFITKGFRKFAKKQGQVHLRKNDLLEKSLHSVVNKNYILSVWRLYHILQTIKKEEKLFDYVQCFNDYLNKYFYLKEVLLDQEFLNIFKKIIDSEILWKKRHTWMMSFTETRKARKLLVWELKDKKSLIYMILKTQDVEY